MSMWCFVAQHNVAETDDGRNNYSLTNMLIVTMHAVAIVASQYRGTM